MVGSLKCLLEVSIKFLILALARGVHGTCVLEASLALEMKMGVLKH